MSMIDKVKHYKPRRTECVLFARPLPLIADEYPDPGEDYSFKAVLDPDDRHLRTRGRSAVRAHEAVLRQGRARHAGHPRADRPGGLEDVAAHLHPHALGCQEGLPPIKLARDEAFILDIWTHPDFRRQAVSFTVAYEMGRVIDNLYPQSTGPHAYCATRRTRPR
ncbi:MAG: hypothetical protein R2716_00690 [Microthrixaceae bacterium]